MEYKGYPSPLGTRELSKSSLFYKLYVALCSTTLSEHDSNFNEVALTQQELEEVCT